MGVAINIKIVSATGVGGVFPFVVVCFDNDISNELYKTDATAGGALATWNHTFALDLTSNIKALVAAGRPEPVYLTFFLFDTGAPGVPPLGSAGVLLATVRDHGRAQGDFPIVNGTGTLRLVVTAEKTKKHGLHLPQGEGDHRFGLTDEGMHRAKLGAAAVGVTALAAGVAGLAVHHKKKKEKEGEEGEHGSLSGSDAASVPSPVPEKKKKKRLFGIGSRDAGSSSDEQGGAEGGEPAPTGSSSHAWWDDSDSGDAAEEGTRDFASADKGEGGDRGKQTQPAGPAVLIEHADVHVNHVPGEGTSAAADDE